jgi:valine dehydrogenase (NAD+)
VLTAYGVFQGMRAAAEQVWGTPSLAGRRVGIAGVGKVGHYLVSTSSTTAGAVVISTSARRRSPAW